MIPVLIDEIIQECGLGSQYSLAIVEREGRGVREEILLPLRHQETLIFQYHAEESSIEESTRQAKRQEKIQPKSSGKIEKGKGGKRKARSLSD